MNNDLESLPGAVVVGVDPSPAGHHALTWAADQARAEGRRLVLVRTTGALGSTGTTFLNAYDIATSPALQAKAREGGEILSAAVAQVRDAHPGLVVDTAVVAEDAVAELRRLAQHAHLIVVGSDAHGLAPHGTPFQVGPRLVGHSACPVVVVPRHSASTVRRHVLVGADLSERSGPVLRFAYEFASLRNLPLTLMHVSREARVDRLADAERALAESVRGFSDEFPDVATRLEVIHGWPTSRLIQQSPLADLLVVGQHHHTPGVHVSPLGHVRGGMLVRAACPVAVVPTSVSADAMA